MMVVIFFSFFHPAKIEVQKPLQRFNRHFFCNADIFATARVEQQISPPNNWNLLFLGGGNPNMFFFIPKMGEDEPILMNIFQFG